MTKARGSSWLTPAPVDPLVCRISWKSRGSGRGGEPARNQVDLACHELPLPPPLSSPHRSVVRRSFIHFAVRIHHHRDLPPPPSSHALPFRLAANNTRNNSRCSIHPRSPRNLYPLFINPRARVLNACTRTRVFIAAMYGWVCVQYTRPCDLCVWPRTRDSRVRGSKRTSKAYFCACLEGVVWVVRVGD